MVTVPLNHYNSEHIINRVADIIREAQPKLDDAVVTGLDHPPDGLADELWGFLIPKKLEDATIKALPEGVCFSTNQGRYTYLQLKIGEQVDNMYTPNVCSYFRAPHIWYMGNSKVCDVVGVKSFSFYPTQFVITLEESALEEGGLSDFPLLKEYAKNLHKCQKYMHETNETVKSAVETMSAFLKKHKTVQQAVKEFGESFLTYLPPHLLELYNKKSEPRKRKPKGEAEEETPPLNLDYLVAKAVDHSLGLIPLA